MNMIACVLLSALYTNSVYCSYYHGPTAKPVVLHNGYLEDTHEVAAAKNAHLATLGQQHRNGADYGYEGSYSKEHSGSHGDIRYHGPTAKPVVLHNGYLADTHEVAAAKNAHLAALGQQHSYGADYGYEGSYSKDHSGSHGDIRYHGPTAKPVVLHNGYLEDTHEVAAAKNAHLATLGQQHRNGADYGYEGSYSKEHSGSHGDIRYHGPTAKPVVLHNGYLADTHEVAAAKNAHLAALGQQHSYGADYGYEGSYSKEHSGSHGDIRYHGPTAKPVVLHNGYLADTHEVAAAKNAHLATLGQQHRNGADYGYEGSYSNEHSGSHGDIRYHGPTAKPVVLHNGYLADTHEVAAAKNAHLATLGQQHRNGADYGYEGSYSKEHSGSHGDIRYHGPTAIPHVLHDGHIADTHEVAAAKAEHFAAVAKAKAHGGYGDHYNGGYASSYGADHGYSHHVVPYHGPLAKPVVLKSGYLADTHNVAAAKLHHLEALHGVSNNGQY